MVKTGILAWQLNVRFERLVAKQDTKLQIYHKQTPGQRCQISRSVKCQIMSAKMPNECHFIVSKCHFNATFI